MANSLGFSIRGSAGAGENTDGVGNRGPNDYHPVVSVLLLLVLAELAFVILLRLGFRSTHGG
jgi:hypothetical protein